MTKYSKIPNSVVDTLSPGALRVLVYLASKPDNFEHSAEQAQEDLKMTEGMWCKLSKELKKQRHLFVKKTYMGPKKIRYDYHVVVDPSLMEPDMTVEEFVESEASSDIDTSNLPVNVIRLCELIDTDLNNAKYLYKKLVVEVGADIVGEVIDTLILYQQLSKDMSPSNAANIFYTVCDLSETVSFEYFYPVSAAVGAKCIPIWMLSAIWRIFDDIMVPISKNTPENDISRRNAILSYLESCKITILPAKAGKYVFNTKYSMDDTCKILVDLHKAFDHVSNPCVSSRITKMKKTYIDKQEHEIAKACADEQAKH